MTTKLEAPWERISWMETPFLSASSPTRWTIPRTSLGQKKKEEKKRTLRAAGKKKNSQGALFSWLREWRTSLRVVGRRSEPDAERRRARTCMYLLVLR